MQRPSSKFGTCEIFAFSFFLAKHWKYFKTQKNWLWCDPTLKSTFYSRMQNETAQQFYIKLQPL